MANSLRFWHWQGKEKYLMERHHAGNTAFDCVQNQLDIFHSSVCLVNEIRGYALG